MPQDANCLQFELEGSIENHLLNGPVFSASERLFLQFRTTQSNSPLFFTGSNESFYHLTLKDGLLHVHIRLPAEVVSDRPYAVTPNNSLIGAFKWFQSSRAGFLTVRDTFYSLPGFTSRLDNYQLHDVLLERSLDKIQISIDDNVAFHQSLHFDEIQASFLESRHIVLGTSREGTFNGQVTKAVLQVDDTVLDILKLAEMSLHGFEVSGVRPIPCFTKQANLHSLVLQQMHLPLRLPLHTEGQTRALFGKLPHYANRIFNWQQIEIDFTSHARDAFVFLLFHRLSHKDPLLAVELRNEKPWLVTRSQAFEIRVNSKRGERTFLRVGAGKISLPDMQNAIILVAGDKVFDYFVATDGGAFWAASEAEIVGLLKTANEKTSHDAQVDPVFGRNLLLGGSNWTVEGELGRDIFHLWSGLGRKKQFSGCIHRLNLNGETVDFEPIVHSRLEHLPLKEGQQLRLSCGPAHTPHKTCQCRNGGVCEDGECNCLATAYTGKLCQTPAKTLTFEKHQQLRMRFPLPHQLEATELQFSFRTLTPNSTLLSSYSLGSFTNETHLFGPIQPDGMRISLVDGCLSILVILENRPSTLSIPNRVNDGDWHVLRVLRTASLLRVQVDGAVYEKRLPGQQSGWPQQPEEAVIVCLGGSDVEQRRDVLDAEDFIVRIHEIRVGYKSPPSFSPFTGQIRHFMFNGIDPLLQPDYLIETPQLKFMGREATFGVGPAITLKTPDCFLRLPSLHLYGSFQLTFSLKTYQQDGVVLFNSGSGDFLAVELVRSQLTISFDMGHGAALQHQRIGKGLLSDGNWHQVIISRRVVPSFNTVKLSGQMDQFLRIRIRSEFEEEEDHNLTIPAVTTGRNFNFNEPLYLGGLPADLLYRFSEKIISKHGIQASGCIGGLGVNNQTQMDVFGLAEATMQTNKTSPVCKWQVIKGCLERPGGAPTCAAYAQHRRLPYCLNGGVCLHVWTSLRCSCEMTTFTGNRCHLPGTALKFGDAVRDAGNPIFIKLTYLHDHQNTNREEIALGLQISWTSSPCTLLYDAGIANLAFNMGGGLVRLKETRRRLDDDNYHRIRVFRHGLATLLEVDELQTKHISPGPLGEQFNDQQSIWLGHAPSTQNFTNTFRGVLSGVFYNGLPICDLAAGLSHRADVHVTRHADIQYVANFRVRLAPDSVFQQILDDFPNLESTSFHDDESAMHESPSGPPGTPTADVAAATVTSPTPHGEWIQFPPRTRQLTDTTPSPLQSHVNIWLLVCLGGAGLVFLVSMLFLVFHCLQRKRNEEGGRQHREAHFVAAEQLDYPREAVCK
ncbi:unnamed protein product [Mesocestoides corti]|uniref:Laminin G domain-containing protein n=1 Tax=Mesocestoides corti TaxID=53468 RepID=A0A158QVQ4_MESCO|nr:unnamed protein product [Mesocestoides corti]